MGCTFKTLRVVYGDFTLGVHGEGFDYIFSYVQGGLESLVKNGYEWLYRCPKPTFWRATTDNDRGSKFHIKSGSWLAADMFIECKDVEVITDGKSQGKPCAPENNKYGGDVFAGNAIYNMLKRHKAHKTVYVDGLAASIASVIVMAGDEIIMPANSYLMIHKAWTYAMGNANDLRETADRLENIEQTIVDTYMENVAENITEDDIKQKMSDETWLSAKDAAELFPRIQEDENIDVAACISSITYNNIPKNVVVKNDDEDDEEEDPDEEEQKEQKEKNSNELDMLDNFVFMEGAIENEQEDA